MRFGVFLRHAFHRPILEPIAGRLRARHEVLVSGSKWDLIAFNPHVIVAGESLRAFRFHYYLPFTLFVHTRHGLASKGVAAEAARFSHYTCITSSFMRDWYAARGARPRRDFWITGYPQMDALFQANAGTPPPFPVPAGRRVVLYAPTFQVGFTSIHMLGEFALERLRGGRDDVFVAIKPHPLIARHHPAWLEAIAAAVKGRDDAFLAREIDTDLMPFLKAADVLVTDVSSAALEYLALDRPIVQLTNPRFRDEPFFDPDGFEWAWRDMGEELHDAAGLPGAIGRALAGADAHRERRRHYRQLLFCDLLDGRSVERVCEKLEGLATEAAGVVPMALAAAWSRVARLALDLRPGGRQPAHT